MNNPDGQRRLNPSLWHSDCHLLNGLKQYVLAFRDMLNPSSNCFDFGCGDLPYKSVFEQVGHIYTGGDLVGSSMADVEFEKNSIVPVPDRSYDAVLSFQVLEHVCDVSRYLFEAKRILKPGGKLFLSTHGMWTYHPYPTDYWRWTRHGLVKTLEDNGFNVVKSDWVLGMLAYGTMLKLQIVKGACAKAGRFGAAVFPFFCVPAQLLMMFEDAIIPDEIARDNAAIYCMVAESV